MNIKQKHHFKTVESYEHLYAKQILKEWLSGKYLRIALEEQFAMDGKILFITDLACYGVNGLEAVYEVVNKHSLDSDKLDKMQIYQYLNHEFKIYEVSSYWIMQQIKKPDKLRYYDYSNKFNI